MITLIVPEYCQSCTDFEPQVTQRPEQVETGYDNLIRCACKVPVFFGRRRVLIERGSIKITCDEEYAICQYCGKEVYDPKVHDRNVKARERAIDECRKERTKRR